MNFANFYIRFETERREVSDPRDLISSDENPWKTDLYYYIQAFLKIKVVRKKVSKRGMKCTKSDSLEMSKNLIPKDPRRVFTDDERYIIWYRQVTEGVRITTAIKKLALVKCMLITLLLIAEVEKQLLIMDRHCVNNATPVKVQTNTNLQYINFRILYYERWHISINYTS